MAKEKNLEGLGGWLTFVGLGIILAPLRMIDQAFLAYSNVFSNGAWTSLTTHGSGTHDPNLVLILFGGLLVSVGLGLAWVFIAFLFFAKKKLFPKCYISILIFSLGIMLSFILAINFVSPDESMFNAKTVKTICLDFGVTLLLCWYILVSKRVKATFIK